MGKYKSKAELTQDLFNLNRTPLICYQVIRAVASMCGDKPEASGWVVSNEAKDTVYFQAKSWEECAQMMERYSEDSLVSKGFISTALIYPDYTEDLGEIQRVIRAYCTTNARKDAYTRALMNIQKSRLGDQSSVPEELYCIATAGAYDHACALIMASDLGGIKS